MAQNRPEARAEIEKLVRYFADNVHQLKAPTFNEAQVRQQLIDPFFEALGWDVRNRQMLPPYRLEVIPEGRVKTSVAAIHELPPPEYVLDDEFKADQRMAAKKPDYRFRLHGSTKFFVEAKKPSVDLINNVDAIFQIKRYGFSARVPVSILTDFEEFRVFDCTRKPFYDKPKVGALKEFDLTYTAYLDEFDKLYDTFSREAVVGGSIEVLQTKYLQKRTGEFTLDRSFLEDLSEWRVELAQDIAKHPQNRRILNTYTLNECVQRILDRIVFLRVCEDRDIEEVGTLVALLRLWQDHPGLSLYDKFNELIKQRRSLYNGLLFSEHECERLVVSDKILEKIFKNINYPLSPYHFDEIGVEILGSIYERFLGRTIRLTEKQVRVEEKPEVRKAGGVYYTPQYIVNYIVENTLGRLLYGEPAVLARSPERTRGTTKQSDLPGKNQITSVATLPRNDTRRLLLTPKQVSKLKIIDIACGSGSFLLGAFQKLIDYHIEWYTRHPEDIKEVHGVRDVYEDAQGQLRLSSRKKRDILINNIYGVDIDPQAVEVTQMSLYLKVLEDENDATLNKPTMLALHEVLLPPLKNNIKCGNSLIGTDFYAQGELFDEDMRRKVNAFDWEMEFPFLNPSVPTKKVRMSPLYERGDVRRTEGFDVVIGNPPYVRIQGFPQEQIRYFSRNFQAASGNFDIYTCFIEKGFRVLRSDGGFGMIVPNKFFRTQYGYGLRKFLSTEKAVHRIVNFGASQVFEATTYTCLLFLKNKANTGYHYAQAEASAESLASAAFSERKSRTLADTSWLFESEQTARLNEKLALNSVRLLDLPADMSRGSSSGNDDVFVLAYGERKVEQAVLRIPVYATDFKKYCYETSHAWRIIFPYVQDSGTYRLMTDEELRNKYPKAYAYLQAQSGALRERKQFTKWFGYSAARNLELHDKAQILVPLLAETGSFALIPDECKGKLCPMASGGFTITIGEACKLNPKYVLALLNSPLLFWKLRRTSNIFRGGWITCTKQYFGELPIRTIDFTKPEEKQMHDELVALVDRMLELHKQLNKTAFASEKEPIERQIAATDKKIDLLVYKLYGLTQGEIKILEEAGR
jgi:adenine-specific DNA-methyltransferase